jgi:hypothetical protein
VRIGANGIDALVEGRSAAAAASDGLTGCPAAQRGAIEAGHAGSMARRMSSDGYDRPFASL